jgi:hypothetical protein
VSAIVAAVLTAWVPFGACQLAVTTPESRELPDGMDAVALVACGSAIGGLSEL